MGLRCRRAGVDGRKRLVVLALLAASGCSTLTGYPVSSSDDAVEIAADAKYFAAEVTGNARSSSDKDRAGLSQRAYRDAVVYGRLHAINIRYDEFERTLTGTSNKLNLGADLAVLALNGFGATIGGATAKAALAAASAGVLGAKSAVDTDLFYQRTLPALLTQMRASRLAALYSVKLGLTQPEDRYPLDQALVDLQAYYIAGTLPSAITQVTAQASAAFERAGQDLVLLRDANFVRRAPQVEGLQTRLLLLSSSEAAAVLREMVGRIAERQEPTRQNLRRLAPAPERLTGTAAQQFLLRWLAIDERTDGFLNEWDAALSRAKR